MTCEQCGGNMTASHENHLYREAGLNHVTLVGHELRRCRACGYDEQAFHRLGPLHRSIALAFARKPSPLAGSEIRFLRGWLGWTGRDFAGYLGVAPETVSRWERSRLAMGPTADRLLRLVAVGKAEDHDYSLDDWKHIGRSRPEMALMVDTKTLATRWEARDPRSRRRSRTG